MSPRSCRDSNRRPFNLSQWCNNSQEPQGIRLEKPDQRHKRQDLVNTNTHPGTASTKASWDFLEQLEGELGDPTVMCGDLNARSSMWNQQGNNPQGKALEEALDDVIFIFNPVTTPLPTQLGARQGDTDGRSLG